ncbi:hypothetical protein [Nocardiopsis ansamitocini]|uniref:Uncharacterized protein n=1 Tax=Nocardiopsis ansamitocini TaxID=1670832 RepID=A0A9W6P7F9_9ACTN|nr:hypothetical protein [Nocardiopsis ansamitocini]GLU48447.1 hypothetical protein Nans01_27980 [Nocardiopsis ansamitocini]
MKPVTAVIFPDGTVNVPHAFQDADGTAVGCGGFNLVPGDDDYERYAAQAITVQEYEAQEKGDPARSAALLEEFKKRYDREHPGRSD